MQVSGQLQNVHTSNVGGGGGLLCQRHAVGGGHFETDGNQQGVGLIQVEYRFILQCRVLAQCAGQL